MNDINVPKQRWSAGQVAYGAWSSTGSPFIAELLARQGFDFIGLDAQHGPFSFDAILHSLMAVSGTGCSPIVRMPSSDPHAAAKVLDAGAHGIIFPMIETAEDAAAAVAACRIHPGGNRSFGPMRAAYSFGRNPVDVSKGAACIVMIETARGADNVEKIAAVDGIDCLYTGPGDLAITYGLPPGLDSIPGEHADAIEYIRRTALAHELPVGIPCADAAAALRLAGDGYSFIPVGADTWWLNAQAGATVTQLGLR
ncbi:4-hydroxy-2-oxoheptanedioate aldolase [Rhodococcus sp. 27YEA15]|uniref:HpcH/HpaI aldolase family protein n=1 Tax=Rhodococcus sp. 27YEA15 TaxID=3156259 RepID=UPI003C7E4715